MPSFETAHLALLFDAPLQSWGYASEFEIRAAGNFPTKSAVAGMICAALAIEKGTAAEASLLSGVAHTSMLAIALPRNHRPATRLTDFHTILDTRRASGALNRQNAVITRRDYLTDTCFGIVLTGPTTLLTGIESALRDPAWGIWLGRKSCIPASPVVRGVFSSRDEAVAALTGQAPLANFTRMEDVDSFEDATDSLPDLALSFGTPHSSGREGRRFALRRVRLTIAQATP